MSSVLQPHFLGHTALFPPLQDQGLVYEKGDYSFATPVLFFFANTTYPHYRP